MMRAKTDKICPAFKVLTKERNRIGHGVWMWTNEERPLVVWHSKLLEENDWIGAEFFDWARFDYCHEADNGADEYVRTNSNCLW